MVKEDLLIKFSKHNHKKADGQMVRVMPDVNNATANQGETLRSQTSSFLQRTQVRGEIERAAMFKVSAGSESSENRAAIEGKSTGSFPRGQWEISWVIRRIKSVPGRHNPAEVIITEPARGVTFPAHLLITHSDTQRHFTHTSSQKGMKALKVN